MTRSKMVGDNRIEDENKVYGLGNVFNRVQLSKSSVKKLLIRNIVKRWKI